jgi:hypothetical protein
MLRRVRKSDISYDATRFAYISVAHVFIIEENIISLCTTIGVYNFLLLSRFHLCRCRRRRRGGFVALVQHARSQTTN